MNLYQNKDWLYQKYWREELSMGKIAKIIGMCPQTICNWLKRLNIPIRTVSESISGKHNPNYRKYGKKSPRWAGEIVYWNKYTYIYKPNHPYSNEYGRIALHRLIAEKVLGRYLKQNEVVHHINKNPSDNRNSNLLICTKGYHQFLHRRMEYLKNGKYAFENETRVLASLVDSNGDEEGE